MGVGAVEWMEARKHEHARRTAPHNRQSPDAPVYKPQMAGK
jgi:hypothetical protein